MEHKTWTNVDRAGWAAGPWDAEPDKEQWTDEATGYACLIKRSRFSGALCGYVGVPEGHPWHGVAFMEIEPSPDVHGGLTYADLCQEGPEGETICHVPGPGEPEPLYWVGFDCGHAWDICPGMEAREMAMGLGPIRSGMGWEAYRPLAYVKSECGRLAEQAAAAAVTS